MVHIRFRFYHACVFDNSEPAIADAPLAAQAETEHQPGQRIVFVLRAEVGYVRPARFMEQDNIPVPVVIGAKRQTIFRKQPCMYHATKQALIDTLKQCIWCDLFETFYKLKLIKEK